MKIKRCYVLLITLCLHICGHLHANPLSGFTLAGEWLYMLPTIDQPYFVIDRVPIGPMEFKEERFRNYQSWHSGYRGEVTYTFSHCWNDLQLRWTHFPTFSDSRTINGNVLIPVITIPAGVFDQLFNQVIINDTFDFHYLDLLAGQTLWHAPCLTLDLQGGMQYGYLKFKETIVYMGNNGEMVDDLSISYLRGVGLEVGAEVAYSPLNCLHVRAQGYASLLVSHREAKRERIVVQNGLLTELGNLKNEDSWNLVPMTNIRLGLGYSHAWKRRCSSLCTLSLEGGYEMIVLFYGANRIFFTSPEPPQSGSIDQLMNFTMHGPYLRLAIGY